MAMNIADVTLRQLDEIADRRKEPAYRVHWLCDCHNIALCKAWGPMKTTEQLTEVTCLRCLKRLRRDALKTTK